MERIGHIPPRVLAPAALALFALVVLVIVVASLSGGSDPSPSERPPRESRQSRTAPQRPRIERSFYVVKPGDTLAEIASRQEVEIGTLLELNPDVDPQALVTGQRIRLRERSADAR